MQLTAAGRRRNIVHFQCLFEGKMLIVHQNGDNHILNFSFGEVYRRIYMYIQKSRFTASLTRRCETRFQTVYPMIYIPK